MGKGSNASKNARARKDKAKRDEKVARAAAGGGGKAGIAKRSGVVDNKCALCMQVFMSTVKEGGLKDHVASRHSGKEFAECFPDFEG
ncbi:hypothetical protein FNF27_01305 [Cafeteria roenbergensis]|nr:hypothetical protein FNF29_07129 [Cafeteria roenbergensis]KAA0161053.1 hypothetical protein FNF28_05201 [Cafeteria roenbergensis]KAA0164043.1 hypothetical protein FNF31_02592 [Cafeteria roenbergensis]KAA0176975.1 hypothetical protein FNF27_01305 [Cafeteria roenbergensis]|eukprot:KAA0147784.1 hypothetical protein FNF29_07129 [Cafeteria roenbergensis]